MSDVLKTGYGIEIQPEWLVDIDGKPFIRFAHLESIAHQQARQHGGFLNCTAHMYLLRPEGKAVYGHARYEIIKDETVIQYAEGNSDAHPENVGELVRNHYPRMAETRAKARALRSLTDCGLTVFEELDIERSINMAANQANKKKTTRKKNPPEQKAVAQQETQNQTTETGEETNKIPERKSIVVAIGQEKKRLGYKQEEAAQAVVAALKLPEGSKPAPNNLSDEELYTVLTYLKKLKA
jgi:hypothetical protein